MLSGGGGVAPRRSSSPGDPASDPENDDRDPIRLSKSVPTDVSKRLLPTAAAAAVLACARTTGAAFRGAGAALPSELDALQGQE